MSGPTLVIDLADPLSPASVRALRELMVGLSCRFTEIRPGSYDVHVPAERLGIEDTRDPDWRKPYPLPLLAGQPTDASLAALVGFNPRREDRRRPFDVYLMGAGAGDESIFESEQAEEDEIEALLGFRAAQAVNVSAACNGAIDHAATALLTAAVLDVIGGVCKAELAPGQASVTADLPGLIAVADDGWDTALVTAEFLRAWVARPGFRLVK
ncbi:DUF6368 family protein [Kitasatospora xanthocidica]|uniref:DUF6368 family protein n=1 Tax=Kitasatospora xanthocidica TaxID=83382 RepID=UPI00167629C7|nr:DUF6368 family protein [Kitasatospora xanthocidica]